MADQTYSPEQMPELIPSLAVSDTRQTLEWFERLGFRAAFTMAMPDGTIGHAHVVRNGVHVMFGPSCADSRPGSTGMQLYINLRGEHVDDLYERARQEGLTITMTPTDQFWGDRIFNVVHPDGYTFIFAEHVRDATPEEMQAAMEQWAAAGAPA
ncbi:MAG TPA: VOC family protein [Chloroflexota bacterium]|nr:VOC family protein [Chloroflexota bacterium]